MAIFSRLSRFFRPSRISRPPPRPKRLAPPADSQLNGQYPSHEEMLRSMYKSAVARDAAYAKRSWFSKMFGPPPGP
ncbi:uncharacterized protein FPRO_10573 [Fusarium proliferatum ET1]|uniref:Uncharacterized protein n=1 Tax=Fusarium proliferatum (strain ET1) TaxID=1227346 RepID=A0A1L7VKP4_FUSPR|nr:uncharacterized protein FPRO_10573 [Fusarium proliferatum ET1]CZR40984.1 uncharacterized protein FPRO_10573 [Fusarium proliferatum ET1]